MDLIPIQASSYPFILEASGDSEDDRSLMDSTGCDCNMSYIDVADDDDVESRTCDSWGTSCANGCVDHDEHNSGCHRNDEDYGNDDEDRLSFREAGPPNVLMESTPHDQEEEEEIVDANAALREEMDAMENRDFWETCLAIGYPSSTPFQSQPW